MRQNKLPITAVMVVYNEENLIERAIKSFYHYVDELIIVDDGSTDNTVKIARQYTKKVFRMPHAGIAEHHRVFTYEKAKNDWILQIDGDEYLGYDLAQNLHHLIKQNVDIYELDWPFFLNNKKFSFLAKRALFRKSKAYFIGAAQEYVKPLTIDTRIRREHYPISNEPRYELVSWETFTKKQIPWAKIHARDLTTPFQKIPKWNCIRTDWEFSTKIRIQHPILMGMMGSSIYHLTYHIKEAIFRRSIYFFYQGIYIAGYFIVLYYFVYKMQRGKKI